MWYRLWQLRELLFARPLTGASWQVVEAVLNPAEQALFTRFGAPDRQHGVRVLQRLQDAGHQHPALLKAALLHDVGKTRVRLGWMDRALVVAGGALLPSRARAWGNGEAAGWRRPFVVRAQHPAWGAEMAAAAGCDPLTVRLIRRHQEKLAGTAVTEEEKLLRALQWADDQS